jgi:hypothetical protein
LVVDARASKRVVGSLTLDAKIVDVGYLTVGIGFVGPGKAPPAEKMEAELTSETLACGLVISSALLGDLPA